MEPLKLFLNVFPGCQCYVERDETGAVNYKQGVSCADSERAHKDLITRLSERLERITAKKEMGK